MSYFSELGHRIGIESRRCGRGRDPHAPHLRRPRLLPLEILHQSMFIFDRLVMCLYSAVMLEAKKARVFLRRESGE